MVQRGAAAALPSPPNISYRSARTKGTSMSIIPIRGLFEAHLTVSDLDRSIAFYRDTLGLPLAHRIAARNVAFFWVPSSDRGMLGLWCIGTSPLSLHLHIAFGVELPMVFESVAALRRAGLTPRSGVREPIDEPIVLSWMPAASVYFDDPDGHSLELICMLDETPRPELGQVSWSKWRRA
jgi:catechol 2,3-dioxygenase-like lactoylglutathione lyase family enzyme